MSKDDTFPNPLLPLVFLVSDGKFFTKGILTTETVIESKIMKQVKFIITSYASLFCKCFFFSLHFFQPFIPVKSGKMVLNLLIATNDSVSHKLGG